MGSPEEILFMTEPNIKDKWKTVMARERRAVIEENDFLLSLIQGFKCSSHRLHKFAASSDCKGAGVSANLHTQEAILETALFEEQHEREDRILGAFNQGFLLPHGALDTEVAQLLL